MSDALLSGPASAWPLALLPLLWWLRPTPAAGRRPHGLPDLAAAGALGLGVALLAAGWMADFHISGGRFVASDFGRYCGDLGAMLDQRWEDWHLANSLLAGWLLAPLAARVGVVDALAWGAVGGVAVTAAATALWAGVLHSRLAGAAAALFSLALGPLVVLSRSLTFYPVQVACTALATSAAAVALARRTPLALLAGGAGVGLALLVDVRGLLVAAPTLAMVVVAALPGPWRRLPLRLALVALPLGLSWAVAGRAYPAGAQPLEHQVMALDARKVAARALGRPPHVPTTTFVWGHTPPGQIPATLLEVRRATADLVPATRDLPMNVEGRARHLRPWAGPIAAALGLALWGLRRRPWLAAALAASLLPAALTVQGVALVELRLRFLAPAAPAVAALLGVAFAVAVRGALPRTPDDAPLAATLPFRRPPGPLREAAALALLLGLLSGALPSWLSPLAPRVSPEVTGQIGKALDQAAGTAWSEDPTRREAQLSALARAMGETHTPGWAACEQRLARDLEAGFAVGGSALRR